MADAGQLPSAGEILERFSGDLQRAATRGDRMDMGVMVLGALEAAQDDPNNRDTVAAIMQVKGKTREEAAQYFDRLDGLSEREQPIVIIKGVGALAASHSTIVIFGRTVPESDHAPSFGAADELGGRRLNIPMARKVGFVSAGLDSDTGKGKAMFAGTAERDGVEDIEANAGYPFEEVHFLSSEEEVDKWAASWPEENDDADSVEEFGLPSLVAYGEDAVRAVAEKLAAQGEGHDLFTRRALDEIGLRAWDGKSLAGGVEISDELAENLRWHFEQALGSFVTDPYSRVRRGDNIAGTLSFLAPLQEKIGIDESAVVGELKSIHGRNLQVSRGDSGKYAARTKEGARAIDAMMISAEKLAEHGVSVSPSSDELRKAGYDLEIRALRDELRYTTMPVLEPITRHRLKRDLLEMRLTALALGVKPRG